MPRNKTGGSQVFQTTGQGIMSANATQMTQQTSFGQTGMTGFDDQGFPEAKIGPFCFDVDDVIDTEVLVNEEV